MMDRRISIAPMMECTDRHFRFLVRLMAPHVLLYTEMVTTGALIHGDYQRFLKFHENEHPIALQLGGNNPNDLSLCARMGEDFGYDEVNLNVGCPSDRVKSGRFGACLMLSPELVADCIAAMHHAVKIPVTVKCRIGVDEQDSYESLTQFIRLVSAAGCHVFIVHARKAWLQGLSPKQNREIPPLRYDVVHQLKQDFPHLSIVINGGIKTLEDVQAQLPCVDGVMIGREAYSNPYVLAEIDQAVYASTEALPLRDEIVQRFVPYLEEELRLGTKLSFITRHLMGLFQGQYGARLWRRYLSEEAYKPNAGINVIAAALALTNA